MQQSWKRKNWSLSRFLRASLTSWTSSSGEETFPARFLNPFSCLSNGRKNPFSPTFLQVRQPRHCPSIHPLIKVILQKHASYQPLHRSNAAPPGRQPENGRSALPAVGVQRLQQDPERPGCSCLHGTKVTCEEKRLARYGAAEIKHICTVYTDHPRFDTKPV